MNVVCWIETGDVLHRGVAELSDGRLIAACGVWCDQTDEGEITTHTREARPDWRRCARCFVQAAAK